jgi:hypothetical protein
VAAYCSIANPFTRLAPGTAARLLARAGRRSRGRVRSTAKWETGRSLAGLAVTSNAMRRQRLGCRHRRSWAAPPHTPTGGAHQLRHLVRHPAGGRHLTKGGLGRGVPGVRYTSPFALAVGQKPRRDALCPSAAPAPRQAGPPSRRPIRPKRAAISRLLAQNLKRDLARLQNREIAGVLERGAGLITVAARAQQPAMPVSGFFRPSTPESVVHLMPAFRAGLKEIGFVEGQI